MSKKSFDDIIRSKLSSFRSSADADWQAFEHIMSKRKAEQSDKSFDTQLARKLNTHGATVPEGSWETFSQRHKLVQHLQSNLKSVKLVEACIVLLMLFIFSGPIIHFNSQTAAENSNIKIKPAPGIEIRSPKSKVDRTDNKSVAEANSDVKQFTEDLNDYAEAELVRSTQKASQAIVNRNNRLGAISSTDNNKYESTLTGLDNESTSLIDAMSITMEIPESIFIPGVQNLKPGLLRIREDVESLNIPFAPIRIYIDQRLDADFISFYSAFDNNYIHTPDDIEYNTDARKTEMYGYSLGLMYSRKRGAFEWLSGLMYSSLDKPWDFTLQYGNSNGWYRFIMTNLHFKMASIPMELNYHLVENHEWSLIARTGIAHSFIMSSQYQTSNSYLGGGSLAPGDEIPTPEDGFSPFENERAFTEGLLQGGALRDNYFMRAYLGAGIQRNISPDLAINFSAAYHRNIINTTIGPNNDRFDKFEISFGLKLRMP